MQKNEFAGFEPVLLPTGIYTLITYINNTVEPLPGNEQERIFDAIRNIYGPWKEARAAELPHSERPLYHEALLEDYNRLVWSYMPLVVTAAYDWFRAGGPTLLEDLFQSGVVGLYQAAELHSIREARLAFAPYADIIIRSYMRRQRMQDYLGTETKGIISNVLYAYLAAERAAGEGGKVDLEAVRTSQEASHAAMFGALAAVATLRSVSSGLPPDYDAAQPEQIQTESLPLSVDMQRALAMLAPKQRQYIEQHFGLRPTQPILSLEEISATERTRVGSIRTSLHNAYRDMRIILASFEQFGANFAAWPDKRFLKNYNVLTYLYRAGQDIPLHRTVDELRMLAQQDLAGREGWIRNKQIVAALYGLYDEKLTATELGERFGFSSTTIHSAVIKVIGPRPS